jgi:hypothetical protein
VLSSLVEADTDDFPLPWPELHAQVHCTGVRCIDCPDGAAFRQTLQGHWSVYR